MEPSGDFICGRNCRTGEFCSSCAASELCQYRPDSAGDSNGGIVGELEGIQRGSYITACNNYGYAINGTNIGGIIASNYSNFSNLRVTQCFGIGETKYPVSLNGKLNANYYLTESGTYLNQTFYDADGKVTKEAPNAFYVTKLDTPGIDTPAGAVRILYQNRNKMEAAGVHITGIQIILTHLRMNLHSARQLTCAVSICTGTAIKTSA